MEGYFSTLGVECTVVAEAIRGRRLVCEFPDSIFSLLLAVGRCSSVTRLALTRRLPASQEPGTPSASDMENVAIFDSPGKGRGLKATKEFWAGDVIFSEPSLAAVVFDRYRNGDIYLKSAPPFLRIVSNCAVFPS